MFNFVPLYAHTTNLLKPFVSSLINKRLKQGKEDKQRLNERFGISSVVRPKGKVVWLHSASVGEVMVALTIIDHLNKKYSNYTFLLTTGTVTSANMLQNKSLPDNVIHQYVPIDVLSYVRSFLEYWKPAMVIFIESELWINLITQAKMYNIPLILLNGKISHKSYKNWLKFKPTATKSYCML